MLTLNCFFVSWLIQLWVLEILILAFALLLTCGADVISPCDPLSCRAGESG